MTSRSQTLSLYSWEDEDKWLRESSQQTNAVTPGHSSPGDICSSAFPPAATLEKARIPPRLITARNCSTSGHFSGCQFPRLSSESTDQAGGLLNPDTSAQGRQVT